MRWQISRTVLVGAALVAAAALAVVAFLSLRAAPGGAAAADNCTPKPCAAPHGFGAYVSAVRVSGGQVRMAVNFINHPHAEGFTDYNHTSPADFWLRSGSAGPAAPVFNSDCPNWGELRIKIGSSAGPVPLCFSVPAAGMTGAQLAWGPDLGFLFDEVRIPLN